MKLAGFRMMNQASKDPQGSSEKLQTQVNVIGFVKSVFKYKNGTPRQPTVCPSATGSLTITSEVFNNPEHSLEGLSEYSHLWILFFFHKNGGSGTKAKVRTPRLGGQKVGVFASRSPHRPSPIGLSLAKIERVEGARIFLSGIDIIDETPVLDIKPYIEAYDMPHSISTMKIDQTPTSSATSDLIKSASWLNEAHNNALTVLFTHRALLQLQRFDTNSSDMEYKLEHMSSWAQVKLAIESVLGGDPRSVYRKEQCKDSLYYFTVDKVHVTCWFDGSIAEVLRIQPILHSDINDASTPIS